MEEEPQIVFESEPIYEWAYPEMPLELPIPYGSVACFVFVWVKGQGATLKVVAVPGSDHAMYMEETDNCYGCSMPTPALWQFTAIDPGSFPFKVAQAWTLDVHAALHWMSNPDSIFEFTGTEYDGPPMATIGDQVTLVPEFTSAELVLQDCVEWLAQEMDAEMLEESGLSASGMRVNELVDGDSLADSFIKFMNGEIK
jgi:hypothetical protein